MKQKIESFAKFCGNFRLIVKDGSAQIVSKRPCDIVFANTRT